LVAGALVAGIAMPGSVAAQAVAPGVQQDEPAPARPPLCCSLLQIRPTSRTAPGRDPVPA
ncbi:hypothetical protein QM306_41825, partial [Burkholderia cenocepacia]|nr:hypothetical protein [Burkholderia cenocepacia]